MSWEFFKNAFGNKHADEWAYSAAAAEIKTGRIREGLMLKAASQAEGDAARTKALYLKFLAETIAEEAAKSRVRKDTSEAVKQIKLQASTAYDAASQSLKHVENTWGKSFSENATIGIAIALLIGWWLTYKVDGDGTSGLPKFILSNLFSGGMWGTAVGRALPTALLMLLGLAVLMCFGYLRKNATVTWFLVLIPVALLVNSQLQDQQALIAYQTGRATNVATMNGGTYPAPSSAPSARDEGYDRTLAQFEQQYPQINPDSPLFNQAATDRIAARMQQRMQSGLRKEDALRASVSEEFGQQQTVRQPAAMPAFKPQMGAAPSASIPERCRQIFIQATSSIPEDVPLADYARIRDRAEDAMNRCAKRR